MTDQLFLINRLRVRDGREGELRSWYAEEHLAEMASIPGIEDARLLGNVDDPTDHLAIYQLTSSDVLSSTAYTDRTPSGRARSALDQLAAPMDRAVWRLLLAMQASDRPPS